jgi:hypothetical protein
MADERSSPASEVAISWLIEIPSCSASAVPAETHITERGHRESCSTERSVTPNTVLPVGCTSCPARTAYQRPFITDVGSLAVEWQAASAAVLMAAIRGHRVSGRIPEDTRHVPGRSRGRERADP